MLTQQTSLQELFLERWFDLSELLSSFVLLKSILSALLCEWIFFTFSELQLLSVLLAAQRKQEVVLVVLFEWCSIDCDDAVLHQGLGTNQFVVGCVVNNI